MGRGCTRRASSGAQIREAYLLEAHLEEADLGYAQLQGTSLLGAQLAGANLEHADLKEAVGLNWAQLRVAKNLDLTRVPPEARDEALRESNVDGPAD